MGGGQAGGPRGAAGGFAGRLELGLGGRELALQRLDAALLQPDLLAPAPPAEPGDQLAENEAEGGGDQNGKEEAGPENRPQPPQIYTHPLPPPHHPTATPQPHPPTTAPPP